MTARWRNEPHETGLRGIGQSPRGYELRIDGEVVIRVSAIGGGWRGPVKGWYWVGLGNNTCNSPVATKEQAKAQAAAWFKANRKVAK